MAQNFIIGVGKLYFARATQDGAPGAERCLGDAESTTLRINEERVTVQSGSGVPRVLVDAVRSTERMIDMVLRDMSLGNIALLFASDTIPVPATTVTGERIAVGLLDGGPWYGLPSARGRRISDLILRPLRGGAAYTLNTHYRTDPGSGTIRILDAGADGIRRQRHNPRVLYDRRRDPHLCGAGPGRHGRTALRRARSDDQSGIKGP